MHPRSTLSLTARGLALFAASLFAGCAGDGGPVPRDQPALRFDDGQLPAPLAQVLEAPERVRLLSVDPRPPEGPLPEGTERVGSWAVLGSCEVDLDTGREALAWVAEGMRRSDGRVAGCFDPRHAVEVVRGERRVTLLICYHCLSLQLLEEDERVGGALTSDSVEPHVSDLWRAHGLPIAPPF